MRMILADTKFTYSSDSTSTRRALMTIHGANLPAAVAYFDLTDFHIERLTDRLDEQTGKVGRHRRWTEFSIILC